MSQARRQQRGGLLSARRSPARRRNSTARLRRERPPRRRRGFEPARRPRHIPRVAQRHRRPAEPSWTPRQESWEDASPVRVLTSSRRSGTGSRFQGVVRERICPAVRDRTPGTAGDSVSVTGGHRAHRPVAPLGGAGVGRHGHVCSAACARVARCPRTIIAVRTRHRRRNTFSGASTTARRVAEPSPIVVARGSRR